MKEKLKSLYALLRGVSDAASRVAIIQQELEKLGITPEAVANLAPAVGDAIDTIAPTALELGLTQYIDDATGSLNVSAFDDIVNVINQIATLLAKQSGLPATTPGSVNDPSERARYLVPQASSMATQGKRLPAIKLYGVDTYYVPGKTSSDLSAAIATNEEVLDAPAFNMHFVIKSVERTAIQQLLLINTTAGEIYLRESDSRGNAFRLFALIGAEALAKTGATLNAPNANQAFADNRKAILDGLEEVYKELMTNQTVLVCTMEGHVAGFTGWQITQVLEEQASGDIIAKDVRVNVAHTKTQESFAGFPEPTNYTGKEAAQRLNDAERESNSDNYTDFIALKASQKNLLLRRKTKAADLDTARTIAKEIGGMNADEQNAFLSLAKGILGGS